LSFSSASSEEKSSDSLESDEDVSFGVVVFALFRDGTIGSSSSWLLKSSSTPLSPSSSVSSVPAPSVLISVLKKELSF
jgi:hypothetical protein